jgi:hypothetical protein
MFRLLTAALLVLLLSGLLPAKGTTPVLLEARQYSLTQGEGSKFPNMTTVTICPRKDGRFDVDVSFVNWHEWGFSGMGAMEKDGWIRFQWVNDRGSEGTSLVYLLDCATRVKLNLNPFPDHRPLILPWTKEPVLDHARTSPGGYLIHLPGDYLSDKDAAYISLKPAKGGKVKISADVSCSKPEDSIHMEGYGTWAEGDILRFDGKDFPDPDTEEGQLHFVSPNKAVLVFTSSTTKSPTKQAQMRRLKARQVVLERELSDDAGLANDIGW